MERRSGPDLIKELEPVFFPKTIAVVGTSADMFNPASMFLLSLIQFGYKGKLYGVHPTEKEVHGIKVYPSLKDIPEPVDFVNISISARHVPSVIDDCIEAGVKAAEIFSAGFREVGEEGKRMEMEIARKAKGKMRIVGPNCFGVYCPRGGLTLLPGAHYPKESGKVAVVSQSGGIATNLVFNAGSLGIRFSKVVSYGNAVDINEIDLLEYLSADPGTEIIALYLEGISDGKRFLELAKSLLGKKPLILWKGGMSETGSRAIHSHTGSLAGNRATWEAVCKQTGAIPVSSQEELLDTVTLLNYLPRGSRRRLAMLDGGGAVGVEASDLCEKIGLTIPPAPDSVQERLKKILAPVGTSIKNPIDMNNPLAFPDQLKAVTEVTMEWDEVDIIIVTNILFHESHEFRGMSSYGDKERAEVILQMAANSPKPILVILQDWITDPEMINVELDRRRVRRRFFEGGIICLSTFSRAARALVNVSNYWDKASKTGF